MKKYPEPSRGESRRSIYSPWGNFLQSLNYCESAPLFCSVPRLRWRWGVPFKPFLASLPTVTVCAAALAGMGAETGALQVEMPTAAHGGTPLLLKESARETCANDKLTMHEAAACIYFITLLPILLYRIVRSRPVGVSHVDALPCLQVSGVLIEIPQSAFKENLGT